MVIARQERTSARGNRFAFAQLSDVSGIYEITIFSELLLAHRDLLEAGKTLVVTVDAQTQNDDLRLTAQTVEPLDRALASVVAGLRIVVDSNIEMETLKGLFVEQRGRGKITVEVRLPGEQEAIVELPPAWSLPSTGRMALETLVGVVEVEDL